MIEPFSRRDFDLIVLQSGPIEHVRTPFAAC